MNKGNFIALLIIALLALSVLPMSSQAITATAPEYGNVSGSIVDVVWDGNGNAAIISMLASDTMLYTWDGATLTEVETFSDVRVWMAKWGQANTLGMVGQTTSGDGIGFLYNVGDGSTIGTYLPSGIDYLDSLDYNPTTHEWMVGGDSWHIAKLSTSFSLVQVIPLDATAVSLGYLDPTDSVSITDIEWHPTQTTKAVMTAFVSDWQPTIFGSEVRVCMLVAFTGSEVQFLANVYSLDCLYNDVEWWGEDKVVMTHAGGNTVPPPVDWNERLGTNIVMVYFPSPLFSDAFPYTAYQLSPWSSYYMDQVTLTHTNNIFWHTPVDITINQETDEFFMFTFANADGADHGGLPQYYSNIVYGKLGDADYAGWDYYVNQGIANPGLALLEYTEVPEYQYMNDMFSGDFSFFLSKIIFGGGSTFVADKSAIVNNNPTVTLADSYTVAVGGTLSLSKSLIVSDNDDDPTTWMVDWGDGEETTVSSSASYTHTYDVGDTYTMTVTAYDDRGGEASDTTQVVVSEYVPDRRIVFQDTEGFGPVVKGVDITIPLRFTAIDAPFTLTIVNAEPNLLSPYGGNDYYGMEFDYLVQSYTGTELASGNTSTGFIVDIPADGDYYAYFTLNTDNFEGATVVTFDFNTIDNDLPVHIDFNVTVADAGFDIGAWLGENWYMLVILIAIVAVLGIALRSRKSKAGSTSDEIPMATTSITGGDGGSFSLGGAKAAPKVPVDTIKPIFGGTPSAANKRIGRNATARSAVVTGTRYGASEWAGIEPYIYTLKASDGEDVEVYFNHADVVERKGVSEVEVIWGGALDFSGSKKEFNHRYQDIVEAIQQYSRMSVKKYRELHKL